jgi:hypothetical protein
LDIVFQSLDLISQIFHGDLIIFNNTVDLELLDTITNGNELVTTPQETFHGDGLDTLGQLIHIGFIIPRLDFEGDGGLGNRLGLVGLLGVIFSNTLSLDLLSFFINLFIIGTEKVNVIFVLSGSRSSSSGPNQKIKTR